MTLTYPIINRARQVLWLVTGKDKVEILGRLRDGDTSIPSGRIEKEHAVMDFSQAKSRLELAQDLTWALINSPAFIFNR